MCFSFARKWRSIWGRKLGCLRYVSVGLLHRKGKPRQDTVERIYYRTPYDEGRVFLFKTQLPLWKTLAVVFRVGTVSMKFQLDDLGCLWIFFGLGVFTFHLPSPSSRCSITCFMCRNQKSRELCINFARWCGTNRYACAELSSFSFLEHMPHGMHHDPSWFIIYLCDTAPK